jgi:hypothetical protein
LPSFLQLFAIFSVALLQHLRSPSSTIHRSLTDTNSTLLVANFAPIDTNATPLVANFTPIDSNSIRLVANFTLIDGNSTLLAANFTPIEVLWPGWDGKSDGVWEYDFFRELFPAPWFAHVGESKKPGVIKCSEESHAKTILQNAASGHTKIVVQTSDEFHGEHKGCNGCVQTFSAVKLVLRQYAFHLPGSYPSLVQIPLGYMVGMFRSVEDGIQHHTSAAIAMWSLSRKTADRHYK